MENLIFRHGCIFLAKCDLYHSIHTDDLHQQWKPHVARKMRPCWIFQLKMRKIEKNSKKWLPRSYLTRTSLFSALAWNKISHMKLQSLKMFKTTKDMFYKQFEFFANWQGWLWGFVNLVLLMTTERPFETLCPYAASFKMISSKSDFIHIFNDFIHVYSPWARAYNPLGTNFWC